MSFKQQLQLKNKVAGYVVKRPSRRCLVVNRRSTVTRRVQKTLANEAALSYHLAHSSKLVNKRLYEQIQS